MRDTPLIYYKVLDKSGGVIAEEIALNERSHPQKGEEVEFTEGIARLFELPGQSFKVVRVKRYKQLKLDRSAAEALGDYRKRQCIEVVVQ